VDGVRSRRLMTLPAVLAVATLAAGCTAAPTNEAAEDFQGTEREVAETIDDFAAAAADRNADEICTSLFATELKDALGAAGANCEDAVGDQLADLNDPEIEVEDITVSGSTAEATVITPYSGEDVEQTLSLSRDGDAWRITGLEPPGPEPQPAS
jgi:hypothetical protein